MKRPAVVVFWSHVEIRGLDQCWLWRAGKSDGGYGLFKFEGHTSNAHRIAFVLTRGRLREGEKSLHHCDNPPCCNPIHLFRGTQTDNMRDCKAKGRMPCRAGESNGNAKLTMKLVRRIRREYRWRCGRDIGRRYGVTGEMITKIIRREAWKDPLDNL